MTRHKLYKEVRVKVCRHLNYPTMVAAPLIYTLAYAVGVLGAPVILGNPIIYNGFAPLNYTKADLDGSVDPYLT